MNRGLDPAKKAQHIRTQTQRLISGLFTDGKFKIDNGYAGHLDALREAAPDSRIVAYIMPFTAELFMLEMEAGRLDDYLQWLDLIVGKFGEVYSFNGVNSFTLDERNFYNSHHVYADASREII